MATRNNVIFEMHGNVAIISLNRPKQRNAIDAETCSQLREAIDALGGVDKLDSQISFDLLQGSFYGGYCGALADGGRRMGVL